MYTIAVLSDKGFREWRLVQQLLNKYLLDHPEGVEVVVPDEFVGAVDVADRWATSMQQLGWPVINRRVLLDYDAYGYDGALASAVQRIADCAPDLCMIFGLSSYARYNHIFKNTLRVEL